MESDSTDGCLSELRRVLSDLRAVAGAHGAYVLDCWGNFWCWVPPADVYKAVVARVTLERVAQLERSPQRGGRLDRILSGRDGDALLRSFAGIYILYLRFAAPFDRDAVRQHVAAALPAVEALTLALPPSGGPGRGPAEGVGVA